MTSWNPQANKVFLQSLEFDDASQRRDFLDQACRDNEQLRLDVNSMLAAHQQAGSFLRDDEVSSGENATLFPVGTVLAGKYTVQRRLGQGGMGLVLLAEQLHPIQRSVAIKLIKTGLDANHIVQRFDQERNALALMDHPNIAKIFDAGVVRVEDGSALETDQIAGDELRRGIPFFAMEFIAGIPVTDYCDRYRLDVKTRLELFIPVCQAVQHAHQKGIVHRDIKPSNILVQNTDGQHIAKVIDFGVAKVSGVKLTEQTLQTSLGSIVGTLEYMSPEQAKLSNDIDTRSDVYALGAVLYELLAGSVPHRRDEFERAGLDEILRIIKEVTPLPPSSQLGNSGTLPNIASDRDELPQRLIKSLQGDLDWIVLKALEKERNRRYDSVAGLAADIRRFLDEEPVVARSPSSLYRLHKAYRRHRLAFWAAGLGLCLLVLGIAGTSAGFLTASRSAKVAVEEAQRAKDAEQQVRDALVEVEYQRDEAETQERIAEAISDFLINDLIQQSNLGVQADRIAEVDGDLDFDIKLKRDPTLLELVDRAVAQLTPERIDKKFPDQPFVQAVLLEELGLVYNNIAEFEKAIPLFRRALPIFEQQQGPAGDRTLATLRQLAFAISEIGNADEALSYAQRAYEMTHQRFGEKHEMTIRSILRIANAYSKQGDKQAAIDSAKRALELCENDVVLSNFELEELQSQCKTSLCIQLTNAGNYEDTVEMLEEVYRYRKNRLGAGHPRSLNSGVMLASAYHRMLQLDMAQPIYESIVPRLIELYGPQHPRAIASMESLGACYHRLGQQNRAVEIFEEVLPLRIDRDGAFSVSVLRTTANLGVNLSELGRNEEAIARLLHVNQHGMKYPGLHWTIVPLCRAFKQNGQLEEAQRVAREHVDFVSQEFSDNPSSKRSALFNLILILIDREDYVEAELQLKELDALNRQHAPNNWNTFNTRSLLGNALLQQQKMDEAESLLQEGYEGMKSRQHRIPRSVKYHLSDAAQFLVDFYEAKGDEKEAAKWRLEVGSLSSDNQAKQIE